MRLIPAIDLKEGRCVRLERGDFTRESRYACDPQALVDHYRALGADWIHLVDLDGARDGLTRQAALIEELARTPGIKLQIGGGLRTRAAVERRLETGAARAVVGSAALDEPAEVRDWIGRFGAERLTLAFDVRLDELGVPCVATHGWMRQSRVSLWEALTPYAGSGLRHVLCTDVGRDGTLSGAHVELYAEAARRHPDIEWQASGGICNAADLGALAASGVAAAISGKALLEGHLALEELRAFLPNA